MALALALALALATHSVRAATTSDPNLQLPAAPSVLLVAPLKVWQPVLDRLDPWLAEQVKAATSPDERVKVLVQKTVVAQARQDWAGALAALHAARELQPAGAGRHTSGLLNELLVLQAQGKHDSPWLRNEIRKAVLSMPWVEVGPSIRALRQALADMEAESVRSYVVAKMDLSTGITKGNAAPPFVLQLLGLRFQLNQVLPQRAALMLGLDDALREREPDR